MKHAETPRNYDRHPPRIPISLEPNDRELSAVLYLALREQETAVHNGATRGKPAEEMSPTEVHELIKATIRKSAYEAIESGTVLAERDRVGLPTVAAWCADTAAMLVHRTYGEPSDDPRAAGKPVR